MGSKWGAARFYAHRSAATVAARRRPCRIAARPAAAGKDALPDGHQRPRSAAAVVSRPAVPRWNNATVGGSPSAGTSRPAKNPQLSAADLAEVKKMRADGEALHKAGKHHEAVDALAKAMKILKVQ